MSGQASQGPIVIDTDVFGADLVRRSPLAERSSRSSSADRRSSRFRPWRNCATERSGGAGRDKDGGAGSQDRQRRDRAHGSGAHRHLRTSFGPTVHASATRSPSVSTMRIAGWRRQPSPRTCSCPTTASSTMSRDSPSRGRSITDRVQRTPFAGRGGGEAAANGQAS